MLESKTGKCGIPTFYVSTISAFFECLFAFSKSGKLESWKLDILEIPTINGEDAPNVPPLMSCGEPQIPQGLVPSGGTK